MQASSQGNNKSSNIETDFWSSSEKILKTNFEIFQDDTLNYWLHRFYYPLRRENGELYMPSSLNCIRAGISHYLTDATCIKSINIVAGPIAVYG